MNLFGMMEITGSALHAQRIRAEVVAVNMANAETTRAENGTPYQRQSVVLQSANGDSFGSVMRRFGTVSEGTAPAGGVDVAGVVSSNVPSLRRYDPSHPDADADGYVSYPDINPVTEMADLMGASRSYGLNASALQAEKGMITASLDLLK
jgi:flagellar basal-body rod protein FlgC